MRLYIDSNVLISYIKGELGGVTKAQFYRVKEFLESEEFREDIFILSDLVLDEVNRKAYYSQIEIEELLTKFKINFEFALANENTKIKAKEIERLTGIHWPDSFHVQLAIDSKSDVVITWNTLDFIKADRLVRCLTPEQL
ncbi:MAG: PIN domain-containing protein [Candidatus Micrarchaeota archaeon]